MSDPNRPEYLIGIGASAGGLEALQDFFNNMPIVYNSAFVVIQHLSPDFKSLMQQLLSNFTKLKIKIVENKTVIEKDTIYLIPPKNNMIVEGGTLYLNEQERGYILNLPIDIFFKSMAKDFQNKSIAVILSGTGSDGSQGILEVSAAGGLVISQDPETAQFDGMPRSAIHTHVVNKVLDAAKIPVFISDYLKNPIIVTEEIEKEEYKKSGDTYGQIFKLLLKKHRVDFTEYKETTVYRRIDRRAKTLLISSIEEYAQRLFNDDLEIEALFYDLLIGVTTFFRDKEAFDILETEHIPAIFQRKIETQQLRIWIAACSTGEEAYSFAILLKEYSEKIKKAFDIKIFASDLNKNALFMAGQGCFTEASLINVSEERKDRFFLKKGDRYYILPELRNMIVFAPQNLTYDPPFTNIDLISCRNFLIYIKPEAQQRVIASFHFSLNRGGILFLGSSEGIGEFSQELAEENRVWKIYNKTNDGRIFPKLPPKKMISNKMVSEYSEQRSIFKGPKILKQRVYDLLLEDYLLDSIVIDNEEEILHTTGRSSEFLNFQPGKVSNNISRLVNQELRSVITSGIHRVQIENKEVGYLGNTVTLDGRTINVDIYFKPLNSKNERTGYFVIQFQNFYDKPLAENNITTFQVGNENGQLIHDLELQLQTTKESLQTALEEAETTNEELQSTNEELLASNEELQSTNEELHSVNEELYTVNSEFQKKISELESLEYDIDNIVHSTGIGTIFLDENIFIRRITPAISENYNILPHDIGRSIETFALYFHHDNFIKNIKEVQLTGKSKTLESTDENGRSIFIKILPYVGGKKNKGIVITFTDISNLKISESKLSQSKKDLDDSSKTLYEFVDVTARDLSYMFEKVGLEMNNLTCHGPGEVKSHCKIMEFSSISENIKNLKRSLMQFSELKFENLKFKLNNLQGMVQLICDKKQALDKNISFDFVSILPSIVCDADVLERVFSELIDNAIKFNNSAHKKISINHTISSQKNIFSIHDNGIGISEDDFLKIFKMFGVLNQSNRFSSKGNGIGLAIVKRSIEMHSGDTWFESKVNSGSTFYFSIPEMLEIHQTGEKST